MENFKLVSEFLSIATRSFELADKTLLNPNSALPLTIGEFMQLDANYKMARPAGSAGDVLTGPSYAYFQFQGSYDTQALGKGPFLFMHGYEADTKVFEDSVGGGAFALNGPVCVGILSTGRVGLLPLPGTPAGDEYVIGYVTRMPTGNNNFLRFRRTDG